MGVVPDLLVVPPSLEDAAPGWVRLLPVGRIVGRDGRTLTLAEPDALLAAFAAGRIDLPVDHGHQSDKPGPGRTGPVPAAGWIKERAVRAGAIWGRVEWTARARELIAGKQCRVPSPVVLRREDGPVARLKGASLVHDPNLRLTALAAREDPMPDLAAFLARLAAALGLAPEAGEADLIAAVEKCAQGGVKRGVKREDQGEDRARPAQVRPRRRDGRAAARPQRAPVAPRGRGRARQGR